MSPVDATIKPRVIVIGGGLLGASITFHLSRNGARCQLIEQADIASGISGTTFGLINAFDDTSHEYFQFRQAGMNEYLSLQDQLGETSSPVWQPTLVIRDKSSGLSEKCAKLKKWGYPCRIMSLDEFNLRLSANSDGSWLGCIVENEAAVDAVNLTRQFLEHAKLTGVDILINKKVVAIEKRASTGDLVVSCDDGSTLISDYIVLAAGHGSIQLLKQLGIALPYDCTYGLIVETKPVNFTLQTVLDTPDVKMRQCVDGRLIFNIDCNEDIDSTDEATLKCIISNKISSALEYFDINIIDRDGLVFSSIKLGKRAIPEDGLPLIGPIGNTSGIYLVFTHSGVTLAPLVGRLLMEEILSGKTNKLISHWNPGRLCAS
ncbi:MAG: FAD-dependent oxidoreductase [Gammaproteobacteria bacterium]|nr:FAD-dependent oxidoreductase [Gammaproteobacteria bacterium]